jgi:DNA-binding beta-propeller fold protein YncE
MADPAPSPTRSRLLRIVAAIAALAAVAGALRLAGAFNDEDEPVDPAPIAAPKAKPPAGVDPPMVETIEVGGHPAAIAAGPSAVFVADAFSSEGDALDPAAGGGLPIPLPDPANSLAATEADVWFGLPDRRAVERRAVLDVAADGETVELDTIPAAIAADAGGAWVLTENAVDRVEAESGEVTDSISAGGFATAFAVADGAIWVVADNREVRKFDASSLESTGDVAEVTDASAIAVGEGYAWVLSATGELTRLALDSLRPVGDPVRIRGALSLTIGEGAVWVTSSDRTATRIDPRSAASVGDPVPVGDEPVAATSGAGAIWVANAGDGTVTRISP